MPMKLDLRSLFNPSFNYSNFMVPGLLIAILQQVILLGIALSWTGEKENGTLPELFALFAISLCTDARQGSSLFLDQRRCR
jgi:ABC-2 type transport system permease protein